MYRKNLLRIGIAVALLLCFPCLVSAGTPGRAQDGWQRLRAASAVPSVALGLSMLVVGGQNLARTRRRRLGLWALSQVEGPSFELYAVPVVGLFALQGLLVRGAQLTLGKRAWLVGAALFGALLVVFYGIRTLRQRRHWDTLADRTVCANCGYIVDGLEGERCPECGSRLAARGEAAPFGRNISLR